MLERQPVQLGLRQQVQRRVQVLLLARVLQQPVRQEPFLRLQVRLFQEQGLVREHLPVQELGFVREFQPVLEQERPVRQVVLLLALAQDLQLLGLDLQLPGPGQLLRQQVPELLLRVPVSQQREQQLEQALGLVQELPLELALELPVWQGRPLGQMQRTFPEGL